MDQLTTKKIEELVRRIIEASHPERIILFGSAARGEMNRYSDLDLLVLVREGSHRRKTAQQIYRNLLGFGLPVDVIVATPSDLENYQDSPGLVYREALREGKVLYVA